jgi:hypothetical protein
MIIAAAAVLALGILLLADPAQPAGHPGDSTDGRTWAAGPEPQGARPSS